MRSIFYYLLYKVIKGIFIIFVFIKLIDINSLLQNHTIHILCTKWINHTCPTTISPKILENFITIEEQTLCKAELSISVQQIDWMEKNRNGEGRVRSIKLNGNELLYRPETNKIYPASAFILPSYPLCNKWYNCLPPYGNIELGKGSRISVIKYIKDDYVFDFEVSLVWQGIHIEESYCSMEGVSYAANTRIDLFYDVQNNSDCPGWNDTSKTSCNNKGKCLCSTSGTSSRICSCNSGYSGYQCEDCDNDHYGKNCEFKCLPCLNGGICSSGINNDGSCTCKKGFDPSTRCSTCLSGFYGLNCKPCPDCNYPFGNCVDGLYGNGACSCTVGFDDSINCRDCLPNFYGPLCAPCNNCSNGTCNSGISGDGSCICDPGYSSGTSCTDCLPGYYGPECKLCESCHERGKCKDGISGDGTCICQVGYNARNRCASCDVGWDFNPASESCECAPEHFGPYCLSCPICAPHGRCNAGIKGDGSCICDVGWSESRNCVSCMNGHYGPNCIKCRECDHGRCNDGIRGTGECICLPGWDASTDCFECIEGYYGRKCKPCPVDCGKGRCSSGREGTGECICDKGWQKDETGRCSFCADGFAGSNCIPCPGTFDGEKACMGHGICTVALNGTAICECDVRYKGMKCEKYEFPVIIVAILAVIAVFTLSVCICTIRRLSRTGGFGIPISADGGYIRADIDGGRNDYIEISDMSDLGLFVSADTRDWLIPFESLTLQSEVGNGTSGQVFRSLYHCGGGSSVVAVKRLYSPITGQEYFQNFFKREVGILSRLHHPNVVRFYGVSYYNRILYIVTDFCPTSLAELIESPVIKGSFEEEFFIKIVTQITSGMGFLHSRNVVHRDLKPANVLITENDDVNICDFGLSRLIDPDMTSMTAEVGTPSYMAPEMATMGGIQCSTKGDVYSFGILLYSVWTRSKPYGDQGMNPFQLMTAVVNGLRPVISVNCPPSLATLMTMCWDVKPERRPSFPEISLMLKDERLLRMPDEDCAPRRHTSSGCNYSQLRRHSKDDTGNGSTIKLETIPSTTYGSFESAGQSNSTNSTNTTIMENLDTNEKLPLLKLQNTSSDDDSGGIT